MKQDQQRGLDSLRRVQGFLDTHADVVGAVGSSEGRKQLDAAVTALTELGTEQGTSDLRLAGQKHRERFITSTLKTEHMQPIATFSRARLRGVPDIAALAKPTAALKGARLVQAAHAMATAAAPHVTALVRGGFPADTLAQLSASANALHTALEDRANTKLGRVGATKGIEKALDAGREAVTMLHAVISKQFATDPQFLAGWHSARRITAKPGVARGTAGAIGEIVPQPVKVTPEVPAASSAA